MKKFLTFLVCIALPQLVGGLSSLSVFPSLQQWYVNLNKPFFTPPSWVFGPAWTTLYLLMGVASFLVVWEWMNTTNTKKKDQQEKALAWYGVQLGLNGLWSIIFFGLRQPLFALLEIFVLIFAILITIKEFKNVNVRAALLLFPYMCWVCFATLLNFSIFLLN